jgi:hypothetical protein
MAHKTLKHFMLSELIEEIEKIIKEKGDMPAMVTIWGYCSATIGQVNSVKVSESEDEGSRVLSIESGEYEDPLQAGK